MTGGQQMWRAVPSSHCVLGEGPVWLSGVELFQWVDILDPAILRWNPYSPGPAERRSLPLEFATVAIPLSDDISLVASRDAIHRYAWSEDSLTEVGRWSFPPDVRFNDGAISSTGEIYIGTMSMERRPGRGALFQYRGDDLKIVIPDLGISNGLGWLRDGTMLHIDSLEPAVWRIENGRRYLHHRFADGTEPDGMAVDRDGTIFVAMWEAAEIRAVSADGIASVAVQVPASCPTSVAIGGRQAELALVTTADLEGRSAEYEGSVVLARLADIRRQVDGVLFARGGDPS